MSRIGKQPIEVPAGVEVKVQDGTVSVKGPKVTAPLQLPYHRNLTIQVEQGGKKIHVTRSGEDRLSRSVHGLTRTLIANMVEGVTKGFEKRLKIEGLGYQARLDKKSVVLTVGLANSIKLDPPPGVTVEVPEATTIVVKGADKQQVGQFAAEIRAARKPEPYQGKGIRYENEVVRRKEGKSFSSGG